VSKRLIVDANILFIPAVVRYIRLAKPFGCERRPVHMHCSKSTQISTKVHLCFLDATIRVISFSQPTNRVPSVSLALCLQNWEELSPYISLYLFSSSLESQSPAVSFSGCSSSFALFLEVPQRSVDSITSAFFCFYFPLPLQVSNCRKKEADKQYKDSNSHDRQQHSLLLHAGTSAKYW